jgi:hypothetical protein
MPIPLLNESFINPPPNTEEEKIADDNARLAKVKIGFIM